MALIETFVADFFSHSAHLQVVLTFAIPIEVTFSYRPQVLSSYLDGSQYLNFRYSLVVDQQKLSQGFLLHCRPFQYLHQNLSPTRLFSFKMFKEYFFYWLSFDLVSHFSLVKVPSTSHLRIALLKTCHSLGLVQYCLSYLRTTIAVVVCAPLSITY